MITVTHFTAVFEDFKLTLAYCNFQLVMSFKLSNATSILKCLMAVTNNRFRCKRVLSHVIHRSV